MSILEFAVGQLLEHLGFRQIAGMILFEEPGMIRSHFLGSLRVVAAQQCKYERHEREGEPPMLGAAFRPLAG